MSLQEVRVKCGMFKRDNSTQGSLDSWYEERAQGVAKGTSKGASSLQHLSDTNPDVAGVKHGAGTDGTCLPPRASHVGSAPSTMVRKYKFTKQCASPRWPVNSSVDAFKKLNLPNSAHHRVLLSTHLRQRVYLKGRRRKSSTIHGGEAAPFQSKSAHERVLPPPEPLGDLDPDYDDLDSELQLEEDIRLEQHLDEQESQRNLSPSVAVCRSPWIHQ